MASGLATGVEGIRKEGGEGLICYPTITNMWHSSAVVMTTDVVMTTALPALNANAASHISSTHTRKSRGWQRKWRCTLNGGNLLHVKTQLLAEYGHQRVTFEPVVLSSPLLFLWEIRPPQTLPRADTEPGCHDNGRCHSNQYATDTLPLTLRAQFSSFALPAQPVVVVPAVTRSAIEFFCRVCSITKSCSCYKSTECPEKLSARQLFADCSFCKHWPILWWTLAALTFENDGHIRISRFLH